MLARVAAFTGCLVVVLFVLWHVRVGAQAQLRQCGNEGEAACGLFERDAFNGACDTGLDPRVEICGCLLRGVFGNCLIPRICTMCRNDVRHRPATVQQYAASWIEWALTNQREQLAIDEPLNWVMHLGTHNSFNSYSDGHQPRIIEFGTQIIDAPNHFYSMTDQLNLGARMLAIDAHWSASNARLCHSFAEAGPTLEALLCETPSIDLDGDPFPGMRYFANGIKEIRNWLRRRPGAILIVNIENYVGCSSDKCQGTAPFIADPLATYLNSQGWLLPDTAGRPLPSRAEMLAMGKRVVMIFNGAVATGVGSSEGAVVSGAYEAWLRRNQDFQSCTNTFDATAGPAVAPRDKFTVVVEDRTLQRGFTELLHQFGGLGPGAFGEISVDDMKQIARCNYAIVATDFLGSQLPAGRHSDVPDFGRHDALVWSWKVGDRGQNGDCALLQASSGRWVSADCSMPRRYACAPPRSESGTADRSTWQPREHRWRITQTAGPWDGGAAACAAEFPYDAAEDTTFAFSVPVNGAQNAHLLAATAGGHDVWLNYTDQVKEGTWIIPRLANVNTPPVADAGPDQTLVCGNVAVLDGSASVDPDGDALTYTWNGPFGTLTGKVVQTSLPAGAHVVSLTVDDGKGGVDTDSVSITVTDTTPPALSVSLSPSVLWPADHALVKVTADVRAQDACEGTDVLVELRSIVSSEPAGGIGAGHTVVDIQEAAFGTGDLEFFLRAERSGPGIGRIYTVTYRATDKSGNAVDVSATVVVPHDKGRAWR